VDNSSNYSNDIDDGIAYSKEDEKRITLATARANVARLTTKPAATVITKAAAMTIKPEPGEDYDHWMARCKPLAMAGDPNLSEERATDECSVIYEESQVPGQPGGVHGYSGKPKGSAKYQRDLDREVKEKLAALADKVARNAPKPVEPPQPELLTATQMQQLFAYFEQRLAEAIATERELMYEDVGKALAEWVQPKLNALHDEIVKYVDAQYKRSDAQMLSNQIRRITSELRDEIRKLNPNNKRLQEPTEPSDLPNPLMHKPVKQLN
jgi:hypothetical protein